MGLPNLVLPRPRNGYASLSVIQVNNKKQEFLWNSLGLSGWVKKQAIDFFI